MSVSKAFNTTFFMKSRVNTEEYTENTAQLYPENLGGAYVRALSILIDNTFQGQRTGLLKPSAQVVTLPPTGK